jgi:hypothetical protein
MPRMAQLIACASCRRHVRASDEHCPFCASSRLPRTILELGIAATATFTLAACYGAPPRSGHYDGSDSVRHAFRVDAEPGGRARATANARARGCDVNAGSALAMRCAHVRLEITETETGLDVRCAGATEAECRALVNELITPPKSE